MPDNSRPEPSNFIRHIIDDDLRHGKNDGRVHTRFPPEPNGYLHVGHVKSICLNFGLAELYPGGKCNLRFDDTNPEKEDIEYTKAIENDVRWLGFHLKGRPFFASDYYQKLYEFAVQLIRDGNAYVCHLSADEIREYRGTLTKPGRDSPYRNRSVKENLELFERMKCGEFKEGECVLRAKIDMMSPNMNMRDPSIYRVRKMSHYRTADKWCIYPMYDYTHCISDALEGITHSLCTLEFEDHRPLYDWYLDQLPVPCHPQQVEFARLNISYMVTSKRKLNELVQGGHVSGWDDPRMPTIIGMRRCGYTPAALRDFCNRIGLTKNDTVIDIGVLENCVRADLDRTTRRVLGVLRPLKVVIENYPKEKTEQLVAPYHPNDQTMGERMLPFSREIYIERTDFMEEPAKRFFRLGPGREVRLRYAYFITCTDIIKNDAGKIIELRCTYDPETKGGIARDGRKVKGTIHWVDARSALETEVRLFDRLFTDPAPDNGKHSGDWKTILNPESKLVIKDAKLEPSLGQAEQEEHFQFERLGYFCVDNKDKVGDRPVFNRTITLRDSWVKLRGK